jgi:hypothetical protein
MAFTTNFSPSIDELPSELLGMIAEELDDKYEIMNFRLTSKQFASEGQRALSRRSTRLCVTTSNESIRIFENVGV